MLVTSPGACGPGCGIRGMSSREGTRAFPDCGMAAGAAGPVPSSPRSRSSLGQRCLFVLLIDTKRPHLGSAEPPLHPWQHGTRNQFSSVVSVAWECISGSSFGDLEQSSELFPCTPCSPSLLPPCCVGLNCSSQATHTPSPHSPSCRCGEDGGTSLGVQSTSGHIWDGHLQEVPTKVVPTKAGFQLPSHDLLETLVERPPLNGAAGDPAAFGGHWSHQIL